MFCAGLGQGVRACRMLRPKLTLHVGEHALTNICYRHRLALLVCIPRRVHVSSFERHFHSIEIPFPIGSVPPLARLTACVYRGFETNRRMQRWTRWNYRELGAKDVKSYGFDFNDDTVHDVSMSSEVTIVCQATRAVSNNFLPFNRTRYFHDTNGSCIIYLWKLTHNDHSDWGII